ncbi:hypothetical protein PYS58_15865 [Chryseobacterium indologenes]|uniref:hypothetical protein n=1 Tax=Chryseobacterium TaxID=59732 RepID=UPI0016238E61|nr:MULTISPECIES: hypothetical protein [Chryseobacterium]MDM1553968.1 hypothetical protein [Chryseobacterium indologenes]WET48043.1 hypothetical protein PYS58_15865 [Chryseobacterium indologenes]
METLFKENQAMTTVVDGICAKANKDFAQKTGICVNNSSYKIKKSTLLTGYSFFLYLNLQQIYIKTALWKNSSLLFIFCW